MKCLNYIFILLTLSCLFSCATDIIDNEGSVKGTVTDVSNNPIEGCLVTITPTNRSTTTNSAGAYLFTELESGTYSLAFAKEGYESQTKDLSVTVGKVANVDVQLKKASQSILVNPEFLDFGDMETSKELYLSKNGGNNTQYSIEADKSWISINPSSGILGNTDVKIIVNIHREGLSDGEFNGNITIKSSFGELSVPVFMSNAKPSLPQVANGEYGYDVTETSFKIDGTILRTGGSEIVEYGHCWSKNENPTIADFKTNFGSTKETKPFTSTISDGIVAGETYHVRAYAINSMGPAYSNSVSVTIPKTTTPTVVTAASTDITKNSAVLNGSITDTGNGEITECGFYYGNTNNPTTKVTCSSVANSFSYTLSSLSEGTTYYYKAYAKNAKGESCGEMMSFTTSSSTSQGTSELGVTTGEVTNLGHSSATLNASISGEFKGAKEIVEYGFYIGENQYQMRQNRAYDLTNNSFELELTKLNPEAKYYYYAYVLCYDRTELKGEMLSFTTQQKPKITYVKYSSRKTTDDALWLTLTATVNPAGLQIVDAGFLMGNLKDGDNLHHSYNNITIVPCEFQDNTVTYDGLAKDYITKSRGTLIIPYFVFEDGTEIYGEMKGMGNGTEIEEQY